MKWFRNRFIDVALICLLSYQLSILYSILFILGIRVLYGIGFYLTFKKLL